MTRKHPSAKRTSVKVILSRHWVDVKRQVSWLSRLSRWISHTSLCWLISIQLCCLISRWLQRSRRFGLCLHGVTLGSTLSYRLPYIVCTSRQPHCTGGYAGGLSWPACLDGLQRHHTLNLRFSCLVYLQAQLLILQVQFIWSHTRILIKCDVTLSLVSTQQISVQP